MTLYEVTGPLKLACEDMPSGSVYLKAGEVVELVTAIDGDGDVEVFGRSSKQSQYIDFESLTPLDEYEEAPDFDWSTVRDYVYEGDE